MPQSNGIEQPGILRRIGTLVGTLMTIAIAGVLVTMGSGVIAERAATGDEGASTQAALTVETVPVVLADGYTVRAEYRGRIEAGRQVDLGFEPSGTLAEVMVDEGDVVAEGDILARLETRSLAAQRAAEVAARDALAAQVELARRTAERQKELNARDFASVQRLDEAELTLAQLLAELRRAEAAILATDIAIEKSVLLAPFDAVIGQRQMDDGARVQPGQPVLTLYEATAPRFRVGVPEGIASALTEGAELTVEIDGRTVTGVIERIRSDINGATRTRDLILTLPAGTKAVEGALGRLSFDRDVAGKGAWVPATALSEGARGLWTVFVVRDGVVAREAVELVHIDGDSAFVRGHLTDTMQVVATGPHRIAAGQSVTQAGS